MRSMPKILVVDDEPHVVRLLQVNLQRAGYEVVTAHNGLQALAKVKEERPSLVVLDLIMPHLSGWDTLKRLRLEPETARLPVILLTAKAQDKDVFDGYQLGCDLYMTKPFNPLELLSFIERILTPSDAPDSKVFEIR